MNAARNGGASAPSNRLAAIDWLALSLFLSPILLATAHSIAGGL